MIFIFRWTLIFSNIEQAAEKAYRTKNADGVSIIVMNPQNGELMAMVNYPEFNLNEPFTLTGMEETAADGQERQALLNQMWRNPCISDTYEPGSTFKLISKERRAGRTS